MMREESVTIYKFSEPAESPQQDVPPIWSPVKRDNQNNSKSNLSPDSYEGVGEGPIVQVPEMATFQHVKGRKYNVDIADIRLDF